MRTQQSRRQFIKKGAVMTAGMWELARLVPSERAAAAGDQPADGTRTKKIIVEKTKKIFSTDGEHQRYNAFTNMDFWRGKYYVVFRQSEKHGGSDYSGKIVLLESSDLESWTDSVVMDLPSHDDRDPKLFATTQRLFLYVTARGRGAGIERTVVSYTEDGQSWSTPQQTYGDRYSFWKPKAHDGLYYVAADKSGKVELLESTDAINWKFVSTISDKYETTETSLVFLKDNRLLALSRQNKSPGGHWPGFSSASRPYTSWNYNLGGEVHFSGPAAALVGDTIVVASRTIVKDWGLSVDPDIPGDLGQRTALYTFNLQTMRLDLQVMLPSERGGDSSYPGIVPTSEDRAVVCWYDGHPKFDHPNPSDIWLAHIRIL